MIEFDKWYISKNGWAFLFLFSIENIKYGIALNSSTNSGYVYVKEKENLIYSKLKKEDIHNRVLMDFYNNILITKRLLITDAINEKNFIKNFN